MNKNIFKYFILISFILSVNTLASASPTPLNNAKCSEYLVGEKQIFKIDFCDKLGWCKLKNKQYYIKKELLNKLNENLYLSHENIKGKFKSYYTKEKSTMLSLYERCMKKPNIKTPKISSSEEKNQTLQEIPKPKEDEIIIPQKELVAPKEKTTKVKKKATQAQKKVDIPIEFTRNKNKSTSHDDTYMLSLISREMRFTKAREEKKRLPIKKREENSKKCSEYLIEKKQLVKIDSCDNIGWCKVQDKELYIKKFLFNRVGKNLYSAHGNIKGRTASYYTEEESTMYSLYERCMQASKPTASEDDNKTIQEIPIPKVEEDIPLEEIAIPEEEVAIPKKEAKDKNVSVLPDYPPSEDTDILLKEPQDAKEKKAMQDLFSNQKSGKAEVSLLDVVVESLSVSYKVKASKDSMNRARLKYEKAFADYYPTVDVSYSHNRNKKSYITDTFKDKKGNQRFESNYTEKTGNVILRQNLYAGNSTQNNIKRLKHRYLFAKYEYQSVLESEASKAIKSYFDIVFKYKALETSTKNIERLEKILNIVQIKYDNGAVSIGRLSSIKASISNAKTLFSGIESRFNEALDYYKFMVGDDFENTFPYEEKVNIEVKDYDVLIEEMLKKNPKLLSFRHSISANKYRLRGQSSKFRPEIDLNLGYETILGQEFYKGSENTLNANIMLKYNLYNGGKDEKEFLIINSKMQEVKHELQYETRKLKWTVEKLHTSLVALESIIKNTEDEVFSSVNMVDSYWEEFKHGEQDLEILLQGQRQLNTAEIKLINSVHNSVKDYFAVLNASGSLLEYFGININKRNFLDFAGTSYRKSMTTIYDPAILHNNYEDRLMKEGNSTLNNYFKKPNEKEEVINEEISSSKSSSKEVTKEERKDIVKSFLLFNKDFINVDDDKYTVVISDFKSITQAFTFMHQHKIIDKTFPYESFLGIKVKIMLAYGVFDTKQEAQKTLDKLSVTSKRYKVEKVKKVKKAYDSYKRVALQEKIKPFTTNKIFKKYFVESPEDFYTINLASFASMKEAGLLIRDKKMQEQTFAFKYGDSLEWVQVVYGIFPSYEKAKDELDKMSKIKLKYNPIIEKIGLKQKLYEKSNAIK